MIKNINICVYLIGDGFVCDLCDAVFTERYKLHRHIDTHRNKVAETCQLCGKFFESSKKFEKHLEIHQRKGLLLLFNY